MADAENRPGKLSGTVAHTYLWATFAAALAILVLLVLRAEPGRLFLQSPNDRQPLAGLTGLNVSLVLLASPVAAAPCGAQLGWGTMRI